MLAAVFYLTAPMFHQSVAAVMDYVDHMVYNLLPQDAYIHQST